VRIRYYRDPETGEPHIHLHGVAEEEVEYVLGRPLEDRPGRDRSRIAIGQTREGRYLRIVYAPDAAPQSIFVITAYELPESEKRALRRRRRRKP